MSPLTYIILLPLLAALLLCLVPRNYNYFFYLVSVGVTFLTMLLAVGMFWQYDRIPANVNGIKFEQLVPWVTSLGISYHVGVDGLNVGLILMGAVVAFAAACCGWEI